MQEVPGTRLQHVETMDSKDFFYFLYINVLP